MPLPIPLIQQDEHSSDCGLSCVTMVLKYYGIEKSMNGLRKDIQIYKDVGSYAPNLGSYLISQGFEVEIVTMNPHLFSQAHKNLSQEKLLEHIKSLAENNKKEKFNEPFRHFIEFMEAGGTINVKVPTAEDIREEIAAERPMIALLTSLFLTDKNPSVFNAHFHVIAGIDDKLIYVNDPLPDEGGQYSYPIEEYLYGVHASAFADIDNASLIKIRKK